MGYKSQADTELDVADYALEEWAKWALSNNGYGASPSLKIMLDVRKNNTYPALPHGVMASYEVIDCAIILKAMKESGERNRSDAIIVKACALARTHGISLKALIKSDQFKQEIERICKEEGIDEVPTVSNSGLLNARYNFAGRYATLRMGKMNI